MAGAATVSMAMPAHAEQPKAAEAKGPAPIEATTDLTTSEDMTSEAFVVTPDVQKNERLEKIKEEKSRLEKQKELDAAHLKKLVDARDNLISDYDTANIHVQQYLAQHGHKKEAKIFAQSLGLAHSINKQILELAQLPENAHKDFSAGPSLDHLEAHLLNYNNPESGSMVQAMQSVLNGNVIASTAGELDKDIHIKYFGSISSRLIHVCTDVVTQEQKLAKDGQALKDLENQEVMLLASD